MFEIFGRTRAEGPIGRDAFYAEALEPEDRLMFDRALAEAARPDALLRVACRIRRRCDHQQRWIQYAARVAADTAATAAPAAEKLTTYRRGQGRIPRPLPVKRNSPRRVPAAGHGPRWSG